MFSIFSSGLFTLFIILGWSGLGFGFFFLAGFGFVEPLIKSSILFSRGTKHLMTFGLAF